MKMPILLLGLACGLTIGFNSTAALIVHEPFNYPAGNLTSLNGGTGWPAAWTNTGNGTVVSPGLAYDDIWNQLLSSGNSCGMNTTANARDLPGTYGSAGQTIYVSFIGRVDSAFAAGLSLNNGNAFGCRIGRVNQPTWQVADLTGVVIDSGLPSTQTSLLVVRLDFAASTVTLRLYVNPPLAAEPATPTGSATRPTFTFNRVLVFGSGANVRLIDEIRLGTTWADVTPHAPAPLQCYAGNVSLPEGNSGTTDFVFNVGLNQTANQSVTVDFLTASGTALVGSDFVATNGSLTLNPGETNKTVTVRVNGDATVEYDESFSLVLTNSVNAGISTQFGSGTGAILDDDFMAPALFAEEQFSYPNGSAISGLGGGTGWSNTWIGSFGGAVVTAPGLTHTDGSFSLAVSSNAASLNGDFVAQTRQIRDLDRVKDGTLYVSFLGRVDSGQVTLTLNKSGVPRFSIGRNFFSANWNVSHPLGDWSVPSTVPATSQSFIVLRVDYSGANMTVRLYVNPALSAEPAPVGQTNLPAARLDSIALSTSGFSGGAAVFDEIRVATTWAAAVPLGPPPLPGITITDATAFESNAGTNLVFRVALSHATTSNVTVNFTTSDGSAIAGGDYVATNGVLTFAPGETTRAIVVAVIGDAVAETNELFSVLLSNPVNATITDGVGLGTILDEDMPPRLAIGPGRVMEGDTGITNAMFRVRLEKIYSGTVSVNYATANGTATAGSDYAAVNGSVTFAPGETWKWIAVPVFGDTTVEPNETFGVILSNPLNCALVNTNGPGLIGDDDTPAPGVTNLILLKNGDPVPGEPGRVFKQFIGAPVINVFNELAFVASTMLMNGTAVETNLWLWLGPTNDLRKVAGTQKQPPETPPGSSYSGEFLFPNLDDEGSVSYLAGVTLSSGGAATSLSAASQPTGTFHLELAAMRFLIDVTGEYPIEPIRTSAEGMTISSLEPFGPVIFQGGRDGSACAAPQHESFELGHLVLFENNDSEFSSVICDSDFGTSTLELAPGLPSPFAPHATLTYVKRVWTKDGNRGYVLRTGRFENQRTILAVRRADGSWQELISTGEELVGGLPADLRVFADIDPSPGFIDGGGDWWFVVVFHQLFGPVTPLQGLYAIHKQTGESKHIPTAPGVVEPKLHAFKDRVVFTDSSGTSTAVWNPGTMDWEVHPVASIGQSFGLSDGSIGQVQNVNADTATVFRDGRVIVWTDLADGRAAEVEFNPPSGSPPRVVLYFSPPNNVDQVATAGAGSGTQRAFNSNGSAYELDNPVSGASSINWRLREVTPVPNQPPRIVVIPDQSVEAGQILAFPITATDPDPGQTVEFSFQSARYGMEFAPMNGDTLFQWTPNLAQIGTWPVAIVATDDGTPPQSATASFNVTVTEPPPANLSVAWEMAAADVPIGTPMQFKITVANGGPAPAENITANLEFSGDFQVTGVAGATPGVGGFDLGALGVGEERLLTITGLAEGQPVIGVQKVTAVSTTRHDENLGDNVATMLVRTFQPPRFTEILRRPCPDSPGGSASPQGFAAAAAADDNCTELVLAWQGQATLQYTPEFGAGPAVWLPAPGNPTNFYTIRITNTQGFFRLEGLPLPPVTLPMIQLSQLDLDLDGVVISNSSWGSADVTFNGSSNVHYLNLSIGLDWRVRNVPVASFLGPDKPHTVTVNFKLTEPGASVSNAGFGFSISTNTLSLAPPSTNSALVLSRPVAAYSGSQGTNLSYRPASNLVGRAAQSFAVGKPVFPNQEQGVNECAPAAVANSLQYLNAVFALGIPASAITIEKMKVATGWTTNGAPAGGLVDDSWVDLKKRYMTAHNLPITTETTKDMNRVMQALAECCDVEVRQVGHVAAIVAVVNMGGGDYALTYSHDVRQGAAGGTIREIVIYDSEAGFFRDSLYGSYWSTDLNEFVIECPSR